MAIVKPSKREGECAVCSDAGAAARQGCKVTDPTPGLMTYPRPRPHQTSSNRHLVGLPTLITLITTTAILRRWRQKRAAVRALRVYTSAKHFLLTSVQIVSLERTMSSYIFNHLRSKNVLVLKV